MDVEVDVSTTTLEYILVISLTSNCQEMESEHPVVRTRGPFDGKFTFTAHEAGDHSICLAPAGASSSNTHIKLYIDVVVGSTRPNIDQDRSHVSNLASKIRDLNNKLDEIRREQQYQREREASYRDLSEATNTRAVWYSVLQIAVLVATCAWQLRHLRVSSVNLPWWMRLTVICRISSTTERLVDVIAVSTTICNDIWLKMRTQMMVDSISRRTSEAVSLPPFLSRISLFRAPPSKQMSLLHRQAYMVFS